MASPISDVLDNVDLLQRVLFAVKNVLEDNVYIALVCRSFRDLIMKRWKALVRSKENHGLFPPCDLTMPRSMRSAILQQRRTSTRAVENRLQPSEFNTTMTYLKGVFASTTRYHYTISHLAPHSKALQYHLHTEREDLAVAREELSHLLRVQLVSCGGNMEDSNNPRLVLQRNLSAHRLSHPSVHALVGMAPLDCIEYVFWDVFAGVPECEFDHSANERHIGLVKSAAFHGRIDVVQRLLDHRPDETQAFTFERSNSLVDLMKRVIDATTLRRPFLRAQSMDERTVVLQLYELVLMPAVLGDKDVFIDWFDKQMVALRMQRDGVATLNLPSSCQNPDGDYNREEVAEKFTSYQSRSWLWCHKFFESELAPMVHLASSSGSRRVLHYMCNFGCPILYIVLGMSSMQSVIFGFLNLVLLKQTSTRDELRDVGHYNSGATLDWVVDWLRRHFPEMYSLKSWVSPQFVGGSLATVASIIGEFMGGQTEEQGKRIDCPLPLLPQGVLKDKLAVISVIRSSLHPGDAAYVRLFLEGFKQSVQSEDTDSASWLSNLLTPGDGTLLWGPGFHSMLSPLLSVREVAAKLVIGYSKTLRAACQNKRQDIPERVDFGGCSGGYRHPTGPFIYDHMRGATWRNPPELACVSRMVDTMRTPNGPPLRRPGYLRFDLGMKAPTRAERAVAEMLKHTLLNWDLYGDAFADWTNVSPESMQDSFYRELRLDRELGVQICEWTRCVLEAPMACYSALWDCCHADPDRIRRRHLAGVLGSSVCLLLNRAACRIHMPARDMDCDVLLVVAAGLTKLGNDSDALRHAVSARHVWESGDMQLDKNNWKAVVRERWQHYVADRMVKHHVNGEELLEALGF